MNWPELCHHFISCTKHAGAKKRLLLAGHDFQRGSHQGAHSACRKAQSWTLHRIWDDPWDDRG